MDRFMLHLQNKGYAPKDATRLLAQARKLCTNNHATIRDARISSKYVEYDISIDKEKLQKLVEDLQPVGILDHAKHVIEEKKEKKDAINEGIFYFNNERFWECHEVLEGVWKNCFEGEKDLVQGIILVAAALVHHQKDEDDICLSILGRAQEKLSRCSGTYYDINIDKLKDAIHEIKNSGKITSFKI
jgi:hypothetical protein